MEDRTDTIRRTEGVAPISRGDERGAMLLKEIDERLYSQWYFRHRSDLANHSPYHHPAWLGAVSDGIGFQLKIVGAFEGGDLVAAVPGFLTRRGPFRLFGSPLRGTLTSYLGPLGTASTVQGENLLRLVADCNAFARRAWGIRYGRYTLRDTPAQTPPAFDQTWAVQHPGSYRLELPGDEEALWSGLKSDCRRNIRRAERLGIEVVPFDDAPRFCRMLDGTYRRHGSTSFHPQRFFNALLTRLSQHGILDSWGAKLDGEVVAAGLFLKDDREMHFVSGASVSGNGNLPTSYPLHWRAIQAAARSGLHCFNSDASRIQSIDQFKKAFGLQLNKRFTLIWAPSYVQRLSKIYISSHKYLRQIRASVSRA